jgi:hypothetical protein
VLSGRGLCDELITRPEESYRLCCVVVCDLETSRMRAPYIYDISHLRVKFGTKYRAFYIQICVTLILLMAVRNTSWPDKSAKGTRFYVSMATQKFFYVIDGFM